MRNLHIQSPFSLPSPLVATFVFALGVCLLIAPVACGTGSEREMQTFTWESKHLKKVAVSAPMNWEWDAKYIEFAEGKDSDATGIQTPRSPVKDHADAIISTFEGPIAEWVAVFSETAEGNEDIMEYGTWKDKVGGHPALFVRTDYKVPEDTGLVGRRTLEVYVMPEGDAWAWRVSCIANLAHEHHIADCEAIVNSVRPS